MQQWKLTLAYDGTSFHGWQIQPSLPTVQGALVRVLREVLGEDTLPQGSGRTDTGVHALAQVASVALATPIPPANLQRALNRALPPSIRILAVEQVSPGFHARHSALRKTYEYRIFPRTTALPRQSPACRTQPDRTQPERICMPHLAPFVWDCPWPLDLASAQLAASLVLGEHDFTSFAAVDWDLAQRTAGAPTPTAVRTIVHSTWHAHDDLLVYRVTGSGFLHHMVRNLVGTFVDCASGRIAPSHVAAILTARDRRTAGQTAPARGLFLHSVEYQPTPGDALNSTL